MLMVFPPPCGAVEFYVSNNRGTMKAVESMLMGFSLLATVACAASSANTGSSASGLSGSTASRLSTPQALLQADKDFFAATTARGIEGWMSVMAPDALRIQYRGGMTKGYDAVRKLDSPLFADPASQLVWYPTESHLFGSGDHGVTIGLSAVMQKQPDGTQVPVYRGRYITTWRLDRQANRWLVTMDTGYPDSTVVLPGR